MKKGEKGKKRREEKGGIEVGRRMGCVQQCLGYFCQMQYSVGVEFLVFIDAQSEVETYSSIDQLQYMSSHWQSVLWIEIILSTSAIPISLHAPI